MCCFVSTVVGFRTRPKFESQFTHLGMDAEKVTTSTSLFSLCTQTP